MNDTNMFDVAYVDNIADAHVLALENLLASKTAAGEAFFISNQEPVYVRDFMLAVWAHFGHRPPFQIYIPLTLAWFAGYCAEWLSWISGREAVLSRGSVEDAIGTRYSNNDKAIRILGYKPKVRLVDGLRLACDDYQRIMDTEAAKKDS